MPKIQWTNLPPALRDHLFDRLRDRKITIEDLYQLKVWRESEPDAPDGTWVNLGLTCISHSPSSRGSGERPECEAHGGFATKA